MSLTIDGLSVLQHVPAFAFKCSLFQGDNTVIKDIFINRVTFPTITQADIPVFVQYTTKHIPGRRDLGVLELEIYGFEETAKKIQSIVNLFPLQVQGGQVVSPITSNNVDGHKYRILLDILDMAGGSVLVTYEFNPCVLISVNIAPIGWGDSGLMNIRLSFRVNDMRRQLSKEEIQRELEKETLERLMGKALV